jgi:putative phosphoribosyl transferase
MIFLDRRDAGRQLAWRLHQFRDEECFVLAMPPGGVPVGIEIARELDAPIDVVVTHRLTVTGQPRAPFGAIAEGGEFFVDPWLVREFAVTEQQLEQLADESRADLERRVALYRHGRPLPDLFERTLILASDGIVGGSVARAVIAVVRRMAPRRIVVATPVASSQAYRILSTQSSAVFCLETPFDLSSLDSWYEKFPPLSDEDALAMLEAFLQERTGELARGEPGGHAP